ncbi:MAG TPA: response regulator [Thermodesulfobacteriota bacterium]|nr:response regulator [Thermodesulfobacteriota bacterium]
MLCIQETIIKSLLEGTGYRLMVESIILAKAGKHSGMSENKIVRVFSSRPSVFNQFTHEKERSIAYLKLAMAELLAEDNFLFSGFCGPLIPREVSHVLHLCLIADMKSRVAWAKKKQGVSDSEALRLIRKEDEERAGWIDTLFQKKDPWDAALYDIVIPTDKMTVDEIGGLIEKNLDQPIIKTSAKSKKAVDDFLLAAQTEVVLAREGHQVGVSARDGVITLTINKHVLMLSRLEEELRSIAGQVPGVRSVATQVGQGFHQADIYRKYNFEAPSKVLLVDDEREFVQTLSERLLLREMGSAVAYDGESALSLIKEDEPEVMILDLKMPGIDGIEVLRRVKSTNPEVEVIILTGHGSEADREVCMTLGAFAYLHKPVDIELLSETLKKANEKIRQKKEAQKTSV